jgi:general secretion pathway protein J
MLKPAARSLKPEAGFTLMEIMVSIAILSGMTILLWGSFSLSSRSKRRIEEIEDRYHQIRIAMGRLTREISLAFLSKHDIPGTNKPRTMFVSSRSHGVDELTFSNLAHVVLKANAKESDQCLIRYFGAPDPEDRKRIHLMRYESRRLGGERVMEQGSTFVLLEDVEELHFEFFDDQLNEWKERWNTTSADGQPDRLPAKVRLTLTLRDEYGRRITFVSAARIFLRDPMWFT